MWRVGHIVSVPTSQGAGRHCLQQLFWFYFCCCDKHLIKSKMGRKVYLADSSRLLLNWVVKGGTQLACHITLTVRSREKQSCPSCLFSASYCFIQLGVPSLGNGTAHSGLVPSTSIISQDGPLQTGPQFFFIGTFKLW